MRVVAIVVHLPSVCKNGYSRSHTRPRFNLCHCGTNLYLTVNRILHEVAESLHLPNRPSCQHRKSQGAYEERKHQNDNAVGHAVEQQNCKTEDAEDCADDTEHPSGEPQGQSECPDDESENYDYGCEQYLE